VLAGCRTGRSRDGEGWGALPSAFLVVGTRTIVATLRPVADADAAALMNIFYDKQGAQHPGSALREAQRTLARTAQPHAWAWFAAWGHAEPSECDQPSASGPP
jgi:CHAT domain-containing protein